MYVPYSRSLYFVDKGRERGLHAELVRDVERWMNQKYAKELGKRPLTIYIVAATRDKLLSALPDGLADIAIGNLTVTEERLSVVDFVAPDEKIVNIEILVTGPASPAIASLDDLSGKTVHVREVSSYHESLVALNARFKKEGKAPEQEEWGGGDRRHADHAPLRVVSSRSVTSRSPSRTSTRARSTWTS